MHKLPSISSAALNIEDCCALRDYLMCRGYLGADDAIAAVKLPGGISNRTVKVTWKDGHSWVLKQALAKLRVNIDWFSSLERIKVEAEALRWLNRHAPPEATPLFVFEDASNHLMSMEAIPDPHENWKSMLLQGSVIPEHFQQFGSLLGTIHRESSLSSAETSRIFMNNSHFQSLRLDPYYRYTAQTTAPAEGFLNALIQEMQLHRVSLVHGDFSPKNTLLYRSKLILLDYEAMHWGDPAFDLGFALTHFLSKAHHMPQVRRRLIAAMTLFWNEYRSAVTSMEWTRDLEPRVVRHSLACLLARVAGKSPLEYLTPEEMARQKRVVLSLIVNPPAQLGDFITKFIQEIEAHEQN